MKFAILDKALHITSETPAEGLEMIKHFRLNPLDHLQALTTGELSHVCPGGRDNGEWFAVSASLGPDWIRPYLDKIKHWTGFEGELPAIACPRYPSGYCVNLCHTHIVESAEMSSDGFTFHGYIHSSDWNGRTAAQRYHSLFADYIAENVGERKSESEFIGVGNGGLFKRNPNYPKRYAPNARATSAEVFQALFDWWLSNRATPGQRDIVARCIVNHRTVCKNDALGAYLLRTYDHGYRVSWGEELITFDQFKGA